MNFISSYNLYHQLKINCNISEQFTIEKIMFGSGGSDNIILGVSLPETKLILKIIPEIIEFNYRIKPNYRKFEIDFYYFLTKNYILTNRTPHIVGIYNNQTCPHLDKIIRSIKSLKCHTLEEKLSRSIKISFSDNILCETIDKVSGKIYDPECSILLLENCPMEFSPFLTNSFFMLVDKKNDMDIDNFLYALDRILFQIIFTLAIIKKDHRGFAHRDLFMRNILLSGELDLSDDDYLAYHYNDKIFYLGANGIYAKINDFGLSTITSVLETNVEEFDSTINEYNHKNSFNEKNDIYNLLYDLYDGANIGSTSLKKLFSIAKSPYRINKEIISYMNKFIRTKTIDKINDNYEYASNIWGIDKISLLENTIKTPNEYLMGKHFNSYLKLPENGRVIVHYNR